MILAPPRIHRLNDMLFIAITNDTIFAISRLSGKNYIVNKMPAEAKKMEEIIDGPNGASAPVRIVISAVWAIHCALSEENPKAVVKLPTIPCKLPHLE